MGRSSGAWPRGPLTHAPQVSSAGPGPTHVAKEFGFPVCLDGSASQAEFFAASGVRELLDSAVEGFVPASRVCS